MFGNVGSLAAFRVGHRDAAILARELSPEFSAEDLVNLPNFRLCMRPSRAGRILPAFSARTFMPSEGARNIGPLAEPSRQRWGRPRAEVELEIADLWEGRMG